MNKELSRQLTCRCNAAMQDIDHLCGAGSCFEQPLDVIPCRRRRAFCAHLPDSLSESKAFA